MKTALVYVGSLKSWRTAISRWYDIFKEIHPDIYLFVEEDQKIFLSEFMIVFGKFVQIKYLHFWTKGEMEKWRNPNPESKIFYQLQLAFQKINLRDYDCVIKMDFNSIIKNDRKINFLAPWDLPEEVVFHYSQDQELFKFNQSSSPDLKKIIWFNKHYLYWSSGENIHLFHENIYEQFGKYYQKGNPLSSNIEYQLFFHAKIVNLEPLLSDSIGLMK